MPERTVKVRVLQSIAGPLFSYSVGEEVVCGDGCNLGLEDASRYVASGAAEWVEKQKRETATRRAPERAARGTARKG